MFYKSAKPCTQIFSIIFRIALLGKQKTTRTAPACPHVLIFLQKWMKLKIGVDRKNKAKQLFDFVNYFVRYKPVQVGGSLHFRYCNTNIDFQSIFNNYLLKIIYLISNRVMIQLDYTSFRDIAGSYSDINIKWK